MCLLVDRLDDYHFFLLFGKEEGEGTKMKPEKNSTIKNSLFFFNLQGHHTTHLVTSLAVSLVLFKNIMPMSSSHFSNAAATPLASSHRPRQCIAT